MTEEEEKHDLEIRQKLAKYPEMHTYFYKKADLRQFDNRIKNIKEVEGP
jgi:hypothetical protein